MGHKLGGGGRKNGGRGDSTLVFGVRDPQLDQFKFISPPLRLYGLRQHLSTFSVVKSDDPLVFKFKSFIKNIGGLKCVSLSGRDMEVVFTGTSAFLLFEGRPAGLKAFPELVGVNQDKHTALVDPNDQFLTILRLTAAELASILRASQAAPAQASESIIPPEGEADLDGLRRKLRSAVILKAEKGFDIQRFAANMDLASVFRDDKDAPCLLISLEGEGVVYTLHVNSEPKGRASNPLVCRFVYGEELCALYRMDVIG